MTYKPRYSFPYYLFSGIFPSGITPEAKEILCLCPKDAIILINLHCIFSTVPHQKHRQSKNEIREYVSAHVKERPH